MLKLDHIKKTFNPGTVNEKAAIRDLSLHLEPGDFATVIGSNGAGKSTMFAAIAGSFITDSGSITLNGKDITFAPEYQRSRVIGRLFQDPLKGTAPHMTIEENLSLAYLRASRGSIPFSRISKKDKEFFREQLSMLDMGLLLDEHTAALDPATAEKVLELTKKIVAKKHTTCLMVTHNMQQALTMGNRTLMMDDGRIVFDVKGEERSRMTVPDLLEKFRIGAGKELDNDRILLSAED